MSHDIQRQKVIDVRQLFINEVQVTATPAELNQLAGVAANSQVISKTAKVALAAVDTGGGVLSWANPESGSIIVTEVVLDVTTKSTGACTLAVGTTATSGTTSSNNLMDALDVGTAAGTFSNLGSPGTAGKAQQKLAAGKWVTASKASGASAGLVGSAYITYYLA